MEKVKISPEKIVNLKLEPREMTLLLTFHLIDMIKLSRQIMNLRTRRTIIQKPKEIAKIDYQIRGFETQLKTIMGNVEMVFIDAAFNYLVEAYAEELSQEGKDRREIATALYTYSSVLLTRVFDEIKSDAQNVDKEND